MRSATAPPVGRTKGKESSRDSADRRQHKQYERNQAACNGYEHSSRRAQTHGHAVRHSRAADARLPPRANPIADINVQEESDGEREAGCRGAGRGGDCDGQHSGRIQLDERGTPVESGQDGAASHRIRDIRQIDYGIHTVEDEGLRIHNRGVQERCGGEDLAESPDARRGRGGHEDNGAPRDSMERQGARRGGSRGNGGEEGMGGCGLGHGQSGGPSRVHSRDARPL
eukprot:1306799-Prymnesium_polylepis.1